MDENPAPPPAQEPRDPRGWIALGVLFLLLVANALAGSLLGTKDRPASRAQERMALRQAVAMRQAFPKMPGVDGQWAGAYREVIRRTEGARDPVGATLHAVAKTEAGLPVTPADVAPLRRGDAARRAIAEGLVAKKLPPERARSLAAKVVGGPFEDRLAAAQIREKAGLSGDRAVLAPPGKAYAMFAVLGLGFLLVAASVSAWVLLFATGALGRAQGPPLTGVTPRDADRLAIRAAQIVGFYFVASFVVGLLPLPTAATYLTLSALICAFVPLISRVPVGGKVVSLNLLGLRREGLGRGIAVGALAFVLELPVSLGLGVLGARVFDFLPAPTHPAGETLMGGAGPLTAFAVLVTAAVAAPFWEEVVFRGMIFPALGRFAGVVVSALVSSFAFAMIHPQGVAAWFALASVALFSCALTRYTRSLVPSVTMHALHNGVLLAVALLIG